MARGAITGFVWGTLLSGVAVATASLTTPMQSGPEVAQTLPRPAEAPGAAAPEVESPANEAPADESPVLEGSETMPEAAVDPAEAGQAEEGAAPETAPLPEPGPETGPDEDNEAPDTVPEAAPEPAETEEGAEAPGANPLPPGADVAPLIVAQEPMAERAAVPPRGAEGLPAQPEDPAEVAIDPEDQLDAPAPVSPASEAPAAELAMRDSDLAPTGFPAGELDALDVAPVTAPEVAAPEATAPEGTEATEAAREMPAPEGGDVSVALSGDEPSATVPPVVSPRLPQVGTEVVTGPEEDLAAAAEAPRLPGQAVEGPLTERGSAGAVQQGAGASPDVVTEDLPPIKAYAADYDASDSRPRMAVVLIDTGDSPVTFNALRSFPYPLSFALDPARPDAQETMRAYRDAGFEVLLRSDLPEGALPADVETSTQAWLQALPETVAVMEAAPGGLQRGRETSEQLAEALAASGQGLVLYPEGLDTARKLAEREGVPAATLFRDFDAQGEDPKVIRRFLDYAALKADQEGGVIMVGRLRPETVSALLVWGLADRASQVQLVPVSAVLTERAE